VWVERRRMRRWRRQSKEGLRQRAAAMVLCLLSSCLGKGGGSRGGKEDAEEGQTKAHPKKSTWAWAWAGQARNLTKQTLLVLEKKFFGPPSTIGII